MTGNLAHAHELSRLGLTPREYSVVELLAQGMPEKGIAYFLGLTPGTVKVYLSRIYQRKHFANNVSCAVWFVRQTEVKCEAGIGRIPSGARCAGAD